MEHRTTAEEFLSPADHRRLVDAGRELPTLAIIMEGGIVQSIVSNNPGAVANMLHSIVVIDYDTQGCDDSDVAQVRQPSGQFADARVYELAVTQAAIGLDDFPKHNPDEEEPEL